MRATIFKLKKTMAVLPLNGYKVIDASSVLMGPYASQWLGDLGAEVIKVEAPAGDSTRQTGPGTEPGMGAVFLGTNRNKRSVVIDLKKSEGQAALQALLAQADVFMHSIRPQKLAAIGLDPDQMRQRHPHLVFATLHGFTESGPYGGRPAYDDIIQGMSGVMSITGTEDTGPLKTGSTIIDYTTGYASAFAIAGAAVLSGFVGALTGEVVRGPTQWVAVLAEWGYYAGFESSRWRATPGKQLCSLVVVDVEGRQLTLQRATLRFAGKILSVMLFGIGLLMVAFTNRKQGLHDLIAGTLVLRRV